MTWNQGPQDVDPFEIKNMEIPSHPEHHQPPSQQHQEPRHVQQAPAPAPQQPASQGGGNGGYQGGGGNGYQRPNNGYNQAPRQGGGYPPRQGGGGGGGFQQRPQGGGGGGQFQRKVLTPEELAAYKLYKTVAITGEDNVPDHVAMAVLDVVKMVQDNDFIIRTSAMRGLEEEVMRHARGAEVHLPWKGFQNMESKFSYSPDEAKELAKRCHPTWDNLKLPIQGFCAKNVRLVLGKDLKSACQLLIIWTEDGAESVRDRTGRTGLTGIAIDIAAQAHVPIINLQRPDAVNRIKAFLNIN